MGVGSGRKKGMKSTGWIRDTVLRIYTEDQVREDWNAIQPVDRMKIAAAWVPKEMKIDSDTQISLIINGVRQVKAIDNAVHQALPEHEDDDL